MTATRYTTGPIAHPWAMRPVRTGPRAQDRPRRDNIHARLKAAPHGLTVNELAPAFSVTRQQLLEDLRHMELQGRVYRGERGLLKVWRARCGGLS